LLVLLDHRVVVAPADQALDREERALRIGDRLTLGGLGDQSLAVVTERDDRGRRAHAFRVFDDLWRRAFHDRDTRIGGAQVGADDLTHVPSFLFWQVDRALAAPGKGSIADRSPADRPSLDPLILIPPRGKSGGRGSYKDRDVTRKPSAHESAISYAARKHARQAPCQVG